MLLARRMKRLLSAIFASALVAASVSLLASAGGAAMANSFESRTNRTWRIENGSLAFDSPPGARFKFGGLVGQRVEANVENWLLRAPQSNPGMLEMFRLRDRQPAPQIVPWAGEFVGKCLISAIQALRMTVSKA